MWHFALSSPINPLSAVISLFRRTTSKGPSSDRLTEWDVPFLLNLRAHGPSKVRHEIFFHDPEGNIVEVHERLVNPPKKSVRQDELKQTTERRTAPSGAGPSRSPADRARCKLARVCSIRGTEYRVKPIE